jgi:hypothetical protein
LIGYNGAMRFQFSLRTILLFVVAASVALAAMRFATAAWVSVIVTATMLTLFVSVALAVCRRGERRYFWIGFAICGTGYFAVAMTPFQFVEHLATSKAVTFLRDKFHPYPYLPPLKNPRDALERTTRDNLWRDYEERTANFRWIGECVWTLILATLGGMFVRSIAGRGAGKSGDPSLSGS